MQNTAAALAPASMPMMSGLASGLRARLWKIAPETPNAAPTSTPVSARGRRSVRTMNSASSVAGAEDRRHDVAQRDREVADADRHAEHDEQRDATGTTATVVVRATAATPDAVRRVAGRERPTARHSSAILRRRTRSMNTGAPITAVTMPTCTSPGRAIDAPDDVGAEQQDRAPARSSTG